MSFTRVNHLGCRVESTVALIGGLLMGALLVLTGVNFGVVEEPAPVAWQQPYGGCDEAWQAPRSPGARDCRLHGWTIQRGFVLRPNNTVAYLRMDPCREEDSDGPCFWNAERQGNGTGTSFIIKGPRDGKHRIWWVKFR